jgi:RHS repeat-associated protein
MSAMDATWTLGSGTGLPTGAGGLGSRDGEDNETKKSTENSSTAARVPKIEDMLPSVNYPKPGGALAAVGEKFTTNPSTGTGSFRIPLALPKARNDMEPAIALTYNTGNGNGLLGMGWSLGLGSISRKTDKGLPRYLDNTIDEDTFILSGTEDLVPELVKKPSGEWARREPEPASAGDDNYLVRKYIPRTEGLYASIEKWTATLTGISHWRVRSAQNTITMYGDSEASRIYDPEDPSKIFSWLLSSVRDDQGNEYVAEYKREDSAGIDLSSICERNRTEKSRSSSLYPKSIKYGNRISTLSGNQRGNDFMFEVIFDYGDHDRLSPKPSDSDQWICRNDAFSSRRSGFEMRTYRLCQRICIFHHFPEEDGVGDDCLVKAYELKYRNIRGNPDDERYGHPNGSFLETVQYKAYARTADGYREASLPPLDFFYTQAHISDQVLEIESVNLDNLPGGLDGNVSDLVDLDGEGISGVLTQYFDCWYYKPPLGDGHYGPMSPVPLKPSIATVTSSDSKQLLVDIDGDGMLEAVNIGIDLAVYSSRDWQGETLEWGYVHHFMSIPNIDWRDPNLRFIDLTGDGLPDILMTKEDVFSWYPSRSTDGFASEERWVKPFDEEEGPRIVLADVLHTVFLADMTGDGLTDLVRISCDEICYWPNHGYGSFGSKVTMSHQPFADFREEFDASRIRLGDIDGSGTTDMIYLGPGGVHVFYNNCGNSWSDGQVIACFSTPHFMNTVKLADVLGNGTSCLVWSSPVSLNRQNIQYIDLTSGTKPNLLYSSVNNMGMETRVHYKSSSKFCLEDKLAGKPWITRLPFPLQVVERVETFDHIARTYFASRYAYHHGHYDGIERELIGFGLVEQWDTDEFAAFRDDQASDWITGTPQNLNEDSHVPPVYSKTWFHLGAWRRGRDISKVLARDYWQEPGAFTAMQRDSMGISESELPVDILLPDGGRDPYDISPDELREACRSLRGSVLRSEIYALDGSDAQSRPYSISEMNYSVNLLQPRLAEVQHAVFKTQPVESLSVDYERFVSSKETGSIADPRTAHSIVLENDYWGNITKSVSIAYGRRETSLIGLTDPQDIDAQTKSKILYHEFRYTNGILETEARRLPQPCENKVYEILHVVPDAFESHITALFRIQEIKSKLLSASDGNHDLAHDDVDGRDSPANEPCRRLLEHARVIYRRDDLVGPLPLGSVQSMVLPYRNMQLVYTDDILQKNLVQHGKVDGSELNDLMLNKAGFTHSDDSSDWWRYTSDFFYSQNTGDTASQELDYAKKNFFLPCRFRDQFHSDNFKTESFVTYDKYRLFPIDMEDPVGNHESVGIRDNDAAKPLVKVGIDYRLLAPTLNMDINGNVSAIAYDTLGACVGNAVMGKSGDGQGDSLDNFKADLTESEIQQYMDDPLTYGPVLLGSATSRALYNPFTYYNSFLKGELSPCFIAAIAREIHQHDLPEGQVSPVQHLLSYHDGIGRVIQKKAQTEPGPVPTRDAQTGRIVVVNGKPVMTTNSVSPRWIGSGWTVFNNKGDPVRKFEAFFTDRHSFEFDVRIGASSIIMYDPLSRPVATLSSDHTWRKTVFSPWREEVWDSNDTLDISDPASDPDVGGYFQRLETDYYLPTWYDARRSGQMGLDEQQAAEKAFVHAGTPNVSHMDSQERRFISVSHNKYKTDDMAPSDPPKEEFFWNRVKFDIQGHEVELMDARSRVVGSSAVNMMNGVIYQKSMDTGEQYALVDVVGRPLYNWNSRGNRFRFTYDQLQREYGTYLKVGDNDEILLEHAEYGEYAQDAEKLNLKGRVFKFYDSSGVTTTVQYDFKGNVLKREQVLVKDFKQTVDWNKTVDLEKEIFAASFTFNALSIPTEAVSPDGSIIEPEFDLANRFKKLNVKIRGSSEATSFITNIEYNARGMRTLIDYGNGVRSEFDFDDLTDRLVRLRSSRNATSYPDDCPRPPVDSWPGCQIQNLNYTYDPVGNICSVKDEAQQRIFFDSLRVDPSCDYTYDAVYRLIEATGREYLGLSDGGTRNSPTVPDANNLFHTRQPFRGNGSALGRYTERYRYDATNNITTMKHIGTSPANPGWTRAYTYEDDTNRLISTQIGNVIENYGYGGNAGLSGNITEVPHLSRLEWDARDRMSLSSRQKTGEGITPETTYYTYDAMGQRVRKVTVREAAAGEDGTIKTQSIYIGMFEIRRDYDTQGANVTEERQTLRVTYAGGKQVALIETKLTSSGDVTSQQIRYQLGNHLGSCCIELDDQARVLSYEEYSPFGTTMYQSISSQSDTPKRYRYTGKERDEESGFYYHGARYYMPWLARWLSCDPAGYVDGLNVYAYAMNNPISISDPTGTQGQKGEQTNDKYSGPFTGTESPDELQAKLHSMNLHYEGSASSTFRHVDPDDPNSPMFADWQVERLYHWSSSGGKGEQVTPGGGSQEEPEAGGEDTGGSATSNGGGGAGGAGGGSGTTGGAEGASGAGGGNPGGGRSWWDRGGSHMVFGGIGLGLFGLALVGLALLTNPAGWFTLLGIALLGASSFVGFTTGAIEMGMSYGGVTNEKQEAEINEAISTTTMFTGSPLSIVGGTAGVMLTHDTQGLQLGSAIGGISEAGGQIVYGVSRMAIREWRFGFRNLPNGMRWGKTGGALKTRLHGVYDIANSASRRRPNPLFNWVRYRNGPANIEFIDMSHVVAKSKFDNTIWRYVLNRPTFVPGKWETTHALLDAAKYNRTFSATSAFRSAYESSRITGSIRYFYLLPDEAQLTLRAGAQWKLQGAKYDAAQKQQQ